MEEYPLVVRRLLWCSLVCLVLRPSVCHHFVCLDTISLCQCDPTKLSVTCSDLGLTAVPLADIPNETSSLGLGGNFLTAVREGTFATLGSLLRLSLENNLIGFVEPWAFNTTKELRYLDLSGNRLATLPSALSALASLRVLNMSGNGLAYLAADDFLSLTKLETLRLENNGLYSIPETVFHPLPHLDLLYLDGNFISADPVRWFANNTQLTQLRLSNNLFELAASVENWFAADLPSLPLEELRLDNNVIRRISEASFRGCSDMKELHLAANKITTVAPGSFSDLARLENLTLGGNLLSGSFPDNLFVHTGSLRSLSLGGNSLSVMSRDAFNGLDQMLDLNLAGNQLEDVFTCNGSCDEAVTNPLLPALRSLHLQSNILVNVPEVRNFISLELLDLSTNRIAYLETYAFNGTSMRWLFLHDNFLSTLSLANFQFLPSLEVVTITGNPWICDCELFWIVDPDGAAFDWKTAVYDDVVCEAPDSAKDMDLHTLNFFGDRRGENGPFAACETADWLTIVIICAVWAAVFALVLAWYLLRTVNYRKGYVGRTMTTKAVKTPPAPHPPTPPHPMARLNKGATFDEPDKSATTEVTFVLTPREGGQTPEGPSKDEQAMEQPESSAPPEITVMPIVTSTV